MNSRFLLSLACAAGLATAVPTYARNDDALAGLLLGGIAGAIIGEHNDHRAAEGAIIGATAGLLLSSIANSDDCDTYVSYREPAYCPPPPPRVVVVPPRHHHRDVIVVRPPCPPRAPVVVVRPGYRHHHRDVVVVRPDHHRGHHRNDARWDRHDRHDNRHDRRDARHDRRDDRSDRRDDRRGDHRYASR